MTISNNPNPSEGLYKLSINGPGVTFDREITTEELRRILNFLFMKGICI